MMNIKAVFSDIDGTLLNDEHKVLDSTKLSIETLHKKNIHFILVSARSPSGIYPILQKNSFQCPIISYSGALILDENKNILYQNGMNKSTAIKIIEFIQENNFDLAWNIYSFDDWISQSRKDERVLKEEKIVESKSREADVYSLKYDQIIHKILCMCNPTKINEIESKIAHKFPNCMVVKSSSTLLEIMTDGINKAKAVTYMCNHLGIDVKNVIAFGDNYNDCEMLELVGYGILMGNAPEDLKNRFHEITSDNNHDGIAISLKKFNVI